MCKLFSCPGSDIVRICHRFSEGVAPCASFSHVLGAIRRGFATDFRKVHRFVQAFFMSRGRYGADLPQIFGGSSSLCKLLSCPRSDKAGICHRFSEGVTSCASYFHVPGTIWCGFATDFRKEHLFVQAFRMSRGDKAGICHRFSEGVTPCASFFHVLGTIW